MEKNEHGVKIEKYKNSFNSNYFKDVISPDKINGFENLLYYTDVINDWHDIQFRDLIKNDNLKGDVKNFTSFLDDLVLLMTNTVELYTLIDRYDFTNKGMINRINKKESDVRSILVLIDEYEKIINNYINKGDYDSSIKVKNYCSSLFNECIKILKNKFSIRIFDSPLENEFDLLTGSDKNIAKKEKPFDFYCEIGALFFQGFIYKKHIKETKEYVYCYKEHEFNSVNSLSNFIKDTVLKTKRTTYSYLQATLKESRSKKDFYHWKTINEKTVKYCKHNKLDIKDGACLKTTN